MNNKMEKYKDELDLLSAEAKNRMVIRLSDALTRHGRYVR